MKRLKENKEENIRNNESGNGLFLEYATKSRGNKIKPAFRNGQKS